MAGAELAERELEEHAGLAETSRRLEEHERPALEERGELGLRRLLPGARRGESGAVVQAPQAFARAQAQLEERGDVLELAAEEAVVRRRECHGLRQAAAGLDEA